MNQETLLDNQIDQLRTAAIKFYDQQVAAGQPAIELNAAWKAAAEIGVVSSGVVIGAAKHLARRSRGELYGPNAPTNILDPQG